MPYSLDQKIKLTGWTAKIRSHKNIIFIDLRQRDDLIQLVAEDKAILSSAKQLGPEDVIKVEGVVRARPKGNENPKIPSGKIEVKLSDIQVLNKCGQLPFEISQDTRLVNDETRLKYRYLDLRSQRMKNNLKIRHETNQFIRQFLNQEGFWEIETPFFTKSTPEGARDYVVPSRLHPGKFYALPQSPQQYKQLLMTAGIEKYFQIARCMRDEDSRGDRQPEFTQLDLEMSFVEREDVMAINEKLLIALVKKVFPQKKIQQIPFPRFTYREAMKQYRTDRPDLRKNKKDDNLLAFSWIVDFPFFEKDGQGGWTFTHNPFSAAKPEHRAWLLKKQNIDQILTSQYDVVLNGWEIGGGSIRNHQREALIKVFEIMGLPDKKIKSNFGHMLEAFGFGTPPHGGIAWGLDRLIAILTNEPNIREVIAFPKTGDGRDPLMGSPAPLDEKQLKELNLKITNG